MTTSAELEPGTRFRLSGGYDQRTYVYTLDRRKRDDEITNAQWSGWWLVGGGGFADHVIDSYIADHQFHVLDDPGYDKLHGELAEFKQWASDACELLHEIRSINAWTWSGLPGTPIDDKVLALLRRMENP